MAGAQQGEVDGPRARTRRRILDAAIRRIAGEGIDEVRIARIAMDAGVSPALVHYHFDSREALLVEALEHSYQLVGDVRIASADGSPATARDRLEAIVEACLPLPGARRDDFLLWAELWLRAARGPELRDVAGRLYGRLHEWVAEVLDAGVAAGEFAPGDTRRRTDRMLALIDGYGVRVLMADPAMPAARARAEILADAAAQLGMDAA
jgi:AcrR family transcriptional regulator